ncbi:hypothetical protein BC332_20197 [Capsicum chinense]|nr:hypothetical protein BC332_20197 [Capsicum chinense]
MPPSGVQVGSVYGGIGDPTTPGWPSTGECERLSDKEVENKGNVPLIPSLPISWADGDVIIRTTSGKVANVYWKGGEDSPIYRVGPGPAIANLSYERMTESGILTKGIQLNPSTAVPLAPPLERGLLVLFTFVLFRSMMSLNEGYGVLGYKSIWYCRVVVIPVVIVILLVVVLYCRE